MTMYSVDLTHDSVTGWWTATSSDAPGVVTQARTVREVIANAREAIACELNVDEAEVRVCANMFDLAPLLEQARDARIAAEHAQVAAALATEAAVRALHERGISGRDTAPLVGISHQRVHQILATSR
jgi:predicted RNase H-like HicB family nuclease